MKTEEYDVIILGTGAAGLTAAFTAANEGLKAAVFEKHDRVGGTTSWSGGQLWVPNNPCMSDVGAKDTREDALAYLAAIGRGLVDPAIMEKLVDAGPEMINYLTQHAGVKFFALPVPDYYPHHPGGKPDGGRSMGTDMFPFEELGEWQDRVEVSPYYATYSRADELGIGSAVPKPPSEQEIARRAIRDERGSGAGLVGVLLAAALRAGVHIETSARGVELVVEDGRVAGVVVETSESLKTVRATRGVILATGGFEWDEEFCKAFLRGPVHKPASITTNTGDGVKMAMKIGAALQNMREAWWIPVTDLPPGINRMNLDMINADRTRPRSILVNREAKRFTNEATNYNAIAGAFYEEDVITFDYRNLPAWIIIDHTNLEKYGSRGTPYSGSTPSWLVEGATLEELAEKLGIPGAVLHETVARWNANAAEGVDPDFHRGESAHDRWWGDPFQKGKIEGTLGPIETAPFYAMELKPGVIGTKGGPKVTPEAQVVDIDGQVIEGLYAVGNASSPTGPGYGGPGGTLGPAMTFAWLAGMHVTAPAES